MKSSLFRYIESFSYGIRSRKTKSKEQQNDLYELMLRENVDAGLLRMFEAFMEAAPQLLLQLIILISQGATDGYPLCKKIFLIMSIKLKYRAK